MPYHRVMRCGEGNAADDPTIAADPELLGDLPAVAEGSESSR
jgi:hypothetical protein